MAATPFSVQESTDVPLHIAYRHNETKVISTHEVLEVLKTLHPKKATEHNEFQLVIALCQKKGFL